ncbi:hypothetical protein KFK09_028444 [Dendrobium nobile]|uniref:Uncharacterized protein n=1 Tax=Dendrobium nobile TaxID=94219 RepID=A0A8T3A1K3_DENNO|nr:hypothetical protein KFK09_028444 [Dendrobium nobile]
MPSNTFQLLPCFEAFLPSLHPPEWGEDQWPLLLTIISIFDDWMMNSDDNSWK